MAYSFEMLGFTFTAEHFRRQIETFFRLAPDGWPCWAFSNHDVMRHVSRWAEHGESIDDLAKLAGALLLSLQGSVCLYQGEELGQVQTELALDEILDPQGLAFWPDDKGRDGCRTPMVWSAHQAHGGFSQGNSTWLPVKPQQLARAVDLQTGTPDSVLALYREMLALRRRRPELRQGTTRFLTADEPILALLRDETVLCLFNLSRNVHTFESPAALRPLIVGSTTIAETTVTLGPNGFMIAHI